MPFAPNSFDVLFFQKKESVDTNGSPHPGAHGRAARRESDGVHGRRGPGRRARGLRKALGARRLAKASLRTGLLALLLGARGRYERNKDATMGSWHRY